MEKVVLYFTGRQLCANNVYFDGIFVVVETIISYCTERQLCANVNQVYDAIDGNCVPKDGNFEWATVCQR